MTNKLILFLVVGLVTVARAYATTVAFDVVTLGTNRYEYTYKVTNDTLASDIQEFTIFFAVSQYADLSIPRPVAGWAEIIINPDLILGNPVEGFYDVLALSS